MNQKTALLISAGLTSFMLVLGGGAAVIANNISASAQPATVQPVITYTNAAPASTGMTSQREQQYIQLINQANAQIKQANAEITSLKEQLRQSQSPTKSQTTQQTITSDQAQTVALNAVPSGSVLRVPDLVDYQGTTAYEVVLDKGTLFIDAKTSAILANSATVQPDTTLTGQRQHQESGEDD